MIFFLALLGLLFLLVLLVVGLWYQASMDLAEAMTTCYAETALIERVSKARSVEELNHYMAATIDCVDSRKSWLAGMIFDREEAREKVAREVQAVGPAFIEEANRYRDDAEEARIFQSDIQAQMEMERLRQQSSQGGGQP